MKKELTIDELFENSDNVVLLLRSLTDSQLKYLIGCAVITLIRNENQGRVIEYGKAEEITRRIENIWKSIEKDLLFSYNKCGK